MMINPSLNVPQAEFINMPQKFKAFVAGFGTGKTWIGCAGMCKQFWEFPGVSQGYFAPSYPQIRDIFYPTIEEVAFNWGLRAEIRTGNHEVNIYEGRIFRGVIKCRSMNKPETIVGFKIGHAVVDEIDILKTHQADIAWKKIIARMRYKVHGLRNGIDVTTTPEGFKFVYERFYKSVKENPSLAKNYGLIQASTYDNEMNLPEDYIQSLYESYPAELINAYLRGLFVNLTSGTVYYEYDKELNNSSEVIQANEELHIGMDFNIRKMSAVIHVLRNGLPHAVEEIMGAYDTADMVRVIKERYFDYVNGDYKQKHEIYVYPDASGQNGSTNGAGKTDIDILQEAGLKVIAKPSNPPVKDRVNSMNAMFRNGKGERRYFINQDKCPKYSLALEQQVYNAFGEPDKSKDTDHPNDAGGYFIYQKFPIVKPAFTSNIKVIY